MRKKARKSSPDKRHKQVRALAAHDAGGAAAVGAARDAGTAAAAHVEDGARDPGSSEHSSGARERGGASEV